MEQKKGQIYYVRPKHKKEPLHKEKTIREKFVTVGKILLGLIALETVSFLIATLAMVTFFIYIAYGY